MSEAPSMGMSHDFKPDISDAVVIRDRVSKSAGVRIPSSEAQ